MEIKIKVTREKVLEFSPENLFYISDCGDKEIYDMMVQCVVDKDGNFLSVADARKLFKKIKYNELTGYFTEFVKAINDAFVNPTNGGSSSSQSTRDSGLPDGSPSS